MAFNQTRIRTNKRKKMKINQKELVEKFGLVILLISLSMSTVAEITKDNTTTQLICMIILAVMGLIMFVFPELLIDKIQGEKK